MARGNGEGSVRQRKDGTWEARYTYGRDEEGKQIQKSIYGKTRRIVVEKLTQIQHSIDTNNYINTTNFTVSEWLDIWLKDYKKNLIKPTTLSTYKNRIENHLKPNLGHIKLKDLTTHKVQIFVNKLIDENISPKHISGIINVLKASIEQAILNEMLNKNVTKNIVMPKVVSKKADILTKEQQSLFIELCKTTYLGNVFIFSLGTGMRIGEVLALTWGDINFINNTISISKTITITKNYDDPHSKWEKSFGDVKTTSSNRIIPIMSPIKKLLLEQMDYQDIWKEKACELYNNSSDLVFTTQVGTPLDPRNMQRTFHNIRKKANINHMSIHSLRHTFASRGLENGVDLKVMQDLLGHSSIKITADLYTHVLPDTKALEISKLENSINY